jgi:hypothetical protein
MRQVLALAFAFLATSGTSHEAGAQTQGRGAPPSVLKRLETFQAPPYPAAEGPSIDRETFDYRRASGNPVPPKPLAFVVDVCMVIYQEVNSIFKPLLATPDDVRPVVAVYQNRDWMKIPGLRPWTHTRFVRSLTDTEREQLVREVTAILKSGAVTKEDCLWG